MPFLYEITEVVVTNEMYCIYNVIHIAFLTFFTSPRRTSVMRTPHIVFSLDLSFYKDSSHHLMSIKSKSNISKSERKFPLPYSGNFYKRSFTTSHLPSLTSTTAFFFLFLHSFLVMLGCAEKWCFTYSVLYIYIYIYIYPFRQYISKSKMEFDSFLLLHCRQYETNIVSVLSLQTWFNLHSIIQYILFLAFQVRKTFLKKLKPGLFSG